MFSNFFVFIFCWRSKHISIDMKKVNDRENFHTFYVDDLNADKLLVNPNRMNFGLPIKKKSGDDNFNFIRLNNEFFLISIIS